jgi:predicted GNAT family N-acyltransferase
MAHSIVMLDKKHDLRSFDCGNPVLNTWLQTTARQHQKKSLSSTFVLVDESSEAVIGFYALAISSMAAKEQLSPSMTKSLPLMVPGITLGRLAVANTAKEQGNGGILLVDAMIRAKYVASQVGGFALFVDAKDEAAAGFYAHFGFEPLPDDPLRLCIPIASIPEFE